MSTVGSRNAVLGAGLVCALSLFLVLAATLFAPRAAQSIPAFARKYQTSCQTCHVVAPALTPFGEAFRLNGYRFPAGADPEMTKIPPVSLGAEGYKKLWPKSVWPGEIPGLPPLAVLYTSTADYNHDTGAVTFGGMGGELEILGAGTLGENFSFWGSVDFARGETGDIETAMERVNLQIRPLDTPELMFKVGAFEPGLMLVSSHRSFMDQELLALTEPAGDNAWTPEPFQQGVEANGILSHRLLYNAGLVEGSGSLGDKSKDVYGRVAYKIGGLSLDGVGKGEADSVQPANPKPWSEKSIAFSAFAYKGKALSAPTSAAASAAMVANGASAGAAPRAVFARSMRRASAWSLANVADDPGENPFRTLGADVAVNYFDLMFRAGYTDRKDDSLRLDGAEPAEVSVKNQFVELDWVAYPWLVPAARYETMKIADDKNEKLSFTINGLVRANIRTFIAADWLKAPGGSFTNEGGTVGVLIGF